VFDASLGDVTTITDISDNSLRYLGAEQTTYYVKVVPIGLDAYVGEYSSAVFAKTDYNHAYEQQQTWIRNNAVGRWDGLFNMVDTAQ
jgi:hypothetical protein